MPSGAPRAASSAASSAAPRPRHRCQRRRRAGSRDRVRRSASASAHACGIGVRARRRAPRGSARGSGRAPVTRGGGRRPAARRARAARAPPRRRGSGAPAAPGRSRGRPPRRPRSTRCSTASVPTCTRGRAQLVVVGRDVDHRLARAAPRAPRAHGSRRRGGSEAGGVAPQAHRRPHGRATWALEVRARLRDRGAAPLARGQLTARDAREQPSPARAVEHAHRHAQTDAQHAHECLGVETSARRGHRPGACRRPRAPASPAARRCGSAVTSGAHAERFEARARRHEHARARRPGAHARSRTSRACQVGDAFLLERLVVLVEHDDHCRGRAPVPTPRLRAPIVTPARQPAPAPSRVGSTATPTPARRTRAASARAVRDRRRHHERRAEARGRERRAGAGRPAAAVGPLLLGAMQRLGREIGDLAARWHGAHRAGAAAVTRASAATPRCRIGRGTPRPPLRGPVGELDDVGGGPSRGPRAARRVLTPAGGDTSTPTTHPLHTPAVQRAPARARRRPRRGASASGTR